MGPGPPLHRPLRLSWSPSGSPSRRGQDRTRVGGRPSPKSTHQHHTPLPKCVIDNLLFTEILMNSDEGPYKQLTFTIRPPFLRLPPPRPFPLSGREENTGEKLLPRQDRTQAGAAAGAGRNEKQGQQQRLL